MNRCPSCRTLVPASWIACRRCGAALPAARSHSAGAAARVARAGAIRLDRPSAAAGTATIDPPARIRLPPAADTMLPGRASDNLLPRRGTDPARTRRLVVGAIVTVALVLSAWTAARVAFTRTDTPSAAPATRDARAETLLRKAADGARTVFIQQGTYAGITISAVETRVRGVPIVAAGTVARRGVVSIRVSGRSTLILATPGAANTCVFARDEPTRSDIAFAVTRGKPCAATGAPRSGWDA